MHGTTAAETAPTRAITYAPVLQQALRDVAAWVEKGTPPPATTRYEDVDGQVVIPPGAADRRGIQPVITLEANGGSRAEVKVGTPVEFSGKITVPPGTGYVVAAEWDFDGSGEFSQAAEVPLKQQSVEVGATYTFDNPGTYFVTLRGLSHRSRVDACEPTLSYVSAGSRQCCWRRRLPGLSSKRLSHLSLFRLPRARTGADRAPAPRGRA